MNSRGVVAFDHVRWIGGGTGAGKSTLARRLAQRHGCSIYSTDATIGAHSDRLSAGAAPMLEAFRRMDLDQRWVLRHPTEKYRTFPWFHGEGFDLLIEDLRALPTNGITIVEGFRLLPRLVRPYLANPSS